MLLQSFAIFSSIGNAVFGNRPMIIGFLHLVFLGFVSLIILTFYNLKGYLSATNKFTKWSLILFSVGVIFNEGLLFVQGQGAMLAMSTSIMPWLLWGTSILMLTGTFMIMVARIKYGYTSQKI